jgi:hypothetical protein
MIREKKNFLFSGKFQKGKKIDHFTTKKNQSNPLPFLRISKKVPKDLGFVP